MISACRHNDNCDSTEKQDAIVCLHVKEIKNKKKKERENDRIEKNKWGRKLTSIRPSFFLGGDKQEWTYSNKKKMYIVTKGKILIFNVVIVIIITIMIMIMIMMIMIMIMVIIIIIINSYCIYIYIPYHIHRPIRYKRSHPLSVCMYIYNLNIYMSFRYRSLSI